MTDEDAAPPAPAARLRDSRALLLVEVLLVAGLFFADARHHVYFSKTPYLLVLGWLSLRLRGMRWKDVGFAAGPQWKTWALAGVLAGIVMEALELFVTRPLLVKATGQVPDLSDFTDLVGNWQLLMGVLAGSWALAAFGEELVWRGWINNRCADLFGRNRAGWFGALAVSSVAFGLADANQGSIGVSENIIDGALLAALYFACGRNLIAPIVAHGITDTVDALIIFSGHYPGLAK